MGTRLRRRHVLLTALAGVTIAALGITATLHASPLPVRNGRIAFTQHTFSHVCCHETADVVTIDPDGGDPRQLTRTVLDGFSEEPAWGQNGNRLFFDSDQADGLPHLFSMNANGHGFKQITSGNGFEGFPSPSPDEKSIAFAGYFPDAAADGAQGIYLTGTHGGGYPSFRRLTFAPAEGFDTMPDFSPDGTRVVFRRVLSESAPNAASAVFVVGSDGRGLEQLTPYSLDATSPRWSPDGTRVVFSSNRDTNFGEQDIWVVGADGGTLTQLTAGGPGNPSLEPDWSPDGSKIVFVHFLPTGFFTQLRVMNADGSNVQVIWAGVDFTIDERPDWGTRH
jgi:Tol biopolymer transport system component